MGIISPGCSLSMVLFPWSTAAAGVGPEASECGRWDPAWLMQDLAQELAGALVSWGPE